MHMTQGILARHSIGTVFVEKRKAKIGRTLILYRGRKWTDSLPPEASARQ
jgi:hypothetical protein